MNRVLHLLPAKTDKITYRIALCLYSEKKLDMQNIACKLAAPEPCFLNVGGNVAGLCHAERTK